MKSKIIDVIIIINCILFSIAFCFILYGSMFHWRTNYVSTDIYTSLYQIGILVAIISGCLYFLENFINTFAVSFKHLFTKEVKHE
jgi:hypothetical protein